MGNRHNVFVTPASLTTFSVASGAIALIWRMLQVLLPNSLAMKSPFIPFVIALLLGVFFVCVDLTDPERIKSPILREEIMKSVIGFINNLILVAAVLSIDTLILQ